VEGASEQSLHQSIGNVSVREMVERAMLMAQEKFAEAVPHCPTVIWVILNELLLCTSVAHCALSSGASGAFQWAWGVSVSDKERSERATLVAQEELNHGESLYGGWECGQ
jgi:hypothetical protein